MWSIPYTVCGWCVSKLEERVGCRQGPYISKYSINIPKCKIYNLQFKFWNSAIEVYILSFWGCFFQTVVQVKQQCLSQYSWTWVNWPVTTYLRLSWFMWFLIIHVITAWFVVFNELWLLLNYVCDDILYQWTFTWISQTFTTTMNLAYTWTVRFRMNLYINLWLCNDIYMYIVCVCHLQIYMSFTTVIYLLIYTDPHATM